MTLSAPLIRRQTGGDTIPGVPARFTARAPPWPDPPVLPTLAAELGMARLGQVHVVHSIQLTALPVQETRAQPGCQPAVVLRQLTGLLRASPAHGSGHGGVLHLRTNGGRRHDQQVGSPGSPAVL